MCECVREREIERVERYLRERERELHSLLDDAPLDERERERITGF